MHDDLESASRFRTAIRNLLEQHAPHRQDWRSLGRIHELCRDAADATGDEYCRTRVHLVAAYAAELLAHEDHSKWDCGTLSGTEFLRRQILIALELYCSRMIRRHADPASAAALGTNLAREELVGA